MKRWILLLAFMVGMAMPASAQFGSRIGFGKNIQYIIDNGTFMPTGMWTFESEVIFSSTVFVVGGGTVSVDAPILGDGSWSDHLRLDSSSVTLIGPNALNKTGDIMTGNLGFSGAYLEMDTGLANPSHTEGRVFWDLNAKTLALYNEEAEVTLQIGQENWIRAKNTENDTLINGEVVYVSGAAGFQTEIERAIANSEATARAIGVVTHDVEKNTIGYVTTLGLAHNINTFDFPDGSHVFLSTHVAGGLSLDPGEGCFRVSIGIVVKQHISQGILLVMPGRQYTQPSTVKDYGAKTAVELRALACDPLPCEAHNTDDHDLYTATGTVAGQWRNTRLGIGP